MVTYNISYWRITMQLPRQIGDKHVLKVSQIIKKRLTNDFLYEKNDLADKTVDFILEKIVNIKNISFVLSKFDKETPDNHADLEILMKDGSSQNINLFLIKNNGQIQIKNPGAKSIFSKYFRSETLQRQFNEFLDTKYKDYLLELLEQSEKQPYFYKLTTRELREKVKKLYPKFSKDIDPVREKFLNSLREYSYELLKKKFNMEEKSGIEHAFNSLLLLEDINIITRYDQINKNVCSGVALFNLKVDFSSPLEIFKKGQNKVGIKIGLTGLGLRFKFESSPASSIKLASSTETFHHINEQKKLNISHITKFKKLMKNHKHSEQITNISNAIGKCHEAIFYFKTLEENTSVNQVDEKVFLSMFAKYSPFLSESQIEQIYSGVGESVKSLFQYFDEKYIMYQIDSIQLVPDSYISDPLDASDMKVNLIVEGKYETESLSLKALKKVQKNTTVKNVGMGTILGPQYFKVGDLTNEIKEVKANYISKKITRMESLELMSKYIGDALEHTNQKNLKVGLQAMLGQCTVVITFYETKRSLVLQHGNISGKVKLLRETPSLIQNTLQWNDSTEQLSLRVKFSKGQSHGWSSLKLACDYKVEV